MQLLGKDFIYRLCKHLESKWFWDFSNDTYKYWGVWTTWKFDHTYTHEKNPYDKSILNSNLSDFKITKKIDVKEFNIQKENIERYFKRNKNNPLKKSILEFYFSNKILYCPYCWLNQFQIIGTSKTSSFDLDHFLPKYIFSKYWLSLYNLFPVCKYCNIKGMKWDRNILKETIWWNIFHPIRWRLSVNFASDRYTLTQIHNKNFDDIFDCKNNRNGLQWEIFETTDKRYKHHLQFFQLRALYLQSPHINNDLNHIKNTHDRIKQSYATKVWLDANTQKSMFLSILDWRYPKWEKDILQYSGGKIKKDVIMEIANKDVFRMEE